MRIQCQARRGCNTAICGPEAKPPRHSPCSACLSLLPRLLLYKTSLPAAYVLSVYGIYPWADARARGPDLSQENTVNDIYEQLAKAVSELSSVAVHDNNSIPGPVGSGGKPLDGYLFGDDGTTVAISSVNDLNRWINKRLKIIKKEMDLRPYPFTLCHLDFSRRNIKLTSDHNKKTNSNYSICLLDWGFAGFYPRCFELASASCINDRDHAYELCLV